MKVWHERSSSSAQVWADILVRALAGVALVAVSWTVIAFSLVCIGLPFASSIGGAASRAVVLRRAIWWGLLAATIEVCALSIFLQLNSAKAAVILILSTCMLGIPGWRMFVRSKPSSFRITSNKMILIGALGFAQLFLALAALGPVTGYDSGLYHLGAIKYASDFSALPGLANLYGPLGYGTAEFPLAAILGNGPWGVEGFRLLNGLIMGLVALDLSLRLISRRSTPGLYIMLAGVITAWIPMVALSDFWVTSPSQDSAVFALVIVSLAYLGDACFGSGQIANSAVAIALGVSTFLIRTTTVIFLISLVVVVCVITYRRRARLRPRTIYGAGALVLVISLSAAAVMAGRDYILSGWLFYPLSILPFGVPWRAADPESLRMATLGFARDPDRTWESISGWEWAGAWLSRLPREWAFWEFVALCCVLLIVILIAVALKFHPRSLKWVFLTMVPSAVTVIVWWTTSPPAFRFIWGPLFSLAAIPVGAGLWRLSRWDVLDGKFAGLTLFCCAVPIMVVTLFSAVARFDRGSLTEHRSWVLGVSIPYAVAPVPLPPVQREILSSGLEISSPIETDQCWGQYPMCTPQTVPTLRLLGDSLSGGFLG